MDCKREDRVCCVENGFVDARLGTSSHPFFSLSRTYVVAFSVASACTHYYPIDGVT